MRQGRREEVSFVKKTSMLALLLTLLIVLWKRTEDVVVVPVSPNIRFTPYHWHSPSNFVHAITNADILSNCSWLGMTSFVFTDATQCGAVAYAMAALCPLFRTHRHEVFVHGALHVEAMNEVLLFETHPRPNQIYLFRVFSAASDISSWVPLHPMCHLFVIWHVEGRYFWIQGYTDVYGHRDGCQEITRERFVDVDSQFTRLLCGPTWTQEDMELWKCITKIQISPKWLNRRLQTCNKTKYRIYREDL